MNSNSATYYATHMIHVVVLIYFSSLEMTNNVYILFTKGVTANELIVG